jgi:hypothetical protein
LQEEVEPFHQEAKGHDRNGGAHPGEKGAFVGGVVAESLLHGAIIPWQMNKHSPDCVGSALFACHRPDTTIATLL